MGHYHLHPLAPSSPILGDHYLILLRLFLSPINRTGEKIVEKTCKAYTYTPAIYH